MKIAIVFACFIAAALAGFGSHTDPTQHKIADYATEPLPTNAFWSNYVAPADTETKESEKPFTFAEIGELVVTLFDSAAGELDDIFPDQALKLAIYQVTQVFSFPKGTPNAESMVVHAFAAVAAWGQVEAQAAAAVDLLLDITNRVFHHIIVSDQAYATHVKSKTTKLPKQANQDTKDAETAIRFALGFPRKAVKLCYHEYREQIVEGTDSIILCEAFAYSTRGFPTDATEKAHDDEKRKLFRDIIDRVAHEARADIREFIFESNKGVGTFKNCIIDEAIALDKGFHTLVIKTGASTSKGKQGIPDMVFPHENFEYPSAWDKVSKSGATTS